MKLKFAKLAFIIASIFLIFVCMTGCGDDEKFPFWVTAHEPVIDLQSASEDGISLIAARMMNDTGDPLTSGTMVFTLNETSRGYFHDEDGLRTKSSSVTIDDGVAEVWFHATLAPEVATITVYGPKYPLDGSVSTTVRVINGSLQSDFVFAVNKLDVTFYDESGYADNTNLSTFVWAWNFGDGAGTSDLRDPNYTYGAAGTYTVRLTITDPGGSTTFEEKSVTVSGT